MAKDYERYWWGTRSEHIRYERNHLIEALERKGMTYEEARQYIRYNPIRDKLGQPIADQTWDDPMLGKGQRP